MGYGFSISTVQNSTAGHRTVVLELFLLSIQIAVLLAWGNLPHNPLDSHVFFFSFL